MTDWVNLILLIPLLFMIVLIVVILFKCEKRGEKMAKLAEMRYRTVAGDLKINTYVATISKKIVVESGLDPEKEIIVKAEKGKIIIEQK